MRPIVRWCLDRPSVVVLATILVLVGGTVGATQLRQQLFPDFDFPFAIVTMEASGFDASTLDQQVGTPVEARLATVDGVESVTTVASEGRLRLYAELSYGLDTDALERDIADAIDELDLPAGIDDPTFAGGFQEQAVVLATISSDDDLATLTEQARQLQADLEGIDGVGRVDVAGGSDPRIVVQLAPEAVAAGITPQQVAEAIAASDLRANVGVLPGERGPVGLVVEGSGAAADVDRLGELLVGTRPLSQLARISTVDQADGGFALVNGDPALTVSVFRTTGSDEVTVVDSVQEVLAEADEELDGEVAVLYETASNIRASIKGLVVEGSLGAIFAVVVIFVFLRSVRGTLVAAVSIPTSLVFGLLAAWMLGLTINIITLAGLTIAVGRVIDDGIVVLENIHKHLERGAPRRIAMVEGTSEVGVAIASSTIATAAVFLPIGLVGGLISEIFLSFSIIVTVALLASLLVAVTVIPVIGSFVLRPSTTPHDPDTDTLARAVVPATRFGIRWRWIVLPVAILSCVGVLAAAMLGVVPTQFLPSEGASQVYGSVQLPPGTSADQARDALAPLDERFGEIDGLEDVQLTYGIQSGNAAFDPTIGATTAEFFLTLDDDADGERVEAQLREFGKSRYPNAFSVAVLSQGPPAGSFQVNVDGRDLESIATAATQVEELLREDAERWDLVEIEAQAAQSIPQLVARVRPGAPVTADAVQSALAAATSTVQLPATGDSLPVTIGPATPPSADPDVLARVPVTTATGESTTLGRVATLELEQAPSFVNRVEGTLSGTITARILDDDTAGTTADIREAVEQLDLPAGVELDWDQGDEAFVQEMFTDMGLAMLVAVTLVFFVLVVFFGSLAHPFTILAPIMFSFIGSFGALIVTGRALGLPAMIGQLLLIGIIVSNSILLVDAALRLRRAGMRRDDAIVHAAQLRVRPVLMTASATIAALTPLSLGISGEGGIISRSLGTVVIGGLLVATALTLVIVPAVFRLLDRDHPMGGTSGDDDPRADARPTDDRPLTGSTAG